MVPESDFAFAFNNASFSDRLLRIEITGGSGEVSNSSIVDWDRDRKRRRLDNDELDNVKSEFNKMREEAQCGYEDDNASPLVLRVKELHVSSPILAAKSPFFFKLFSNGMLESEQRQVTLNVDASEEAAVMEVLNFIYSNSLSVTTVPAAVLDVLMAADKFEVASCIDYCTRLLLSMPMTVELALLLLDLPPSVVATDSVKPLTNAARQFIASHYKDLHKDRLQEVLALPLVAIEALLASDDLQIISEEILYDTVLKWAETHYTGLEERQEILGSRLANYIRFPHMSCSKLRKILTSSDFRPHVASSLVLEALFLKAESMLRQPTLPSERAYKCRPIQVVRFEVPRQQCIVYLDIKHKECAGMYPNFRVLSETFYIGGHGFALTVKCNGAQPASFCCFGLLCTTGRESVSLSMDYEFAVRSKPTNEFVRKCKGEYNFTGGKSVGHRPLFMIPWESFIATDSPYFISDVLNIRADLSIRL